MRSWLSLLLILCLLGGNLTWAVDVDEPSHPDGPALLADDGAPSAPADHGGSCDHWCHGDAHLSGLLTRADTLPLVTANRTLPASDILPRARHDAPPTPPPIV